jgi:hypothetical protein
MLVSHDQNAGQNCDRKVTNRLFKKEAEFKYLRMTATKENMIQEEIN